MAAQDAVNSLGVRDVLLRENARGESRGGVRILDRHCALEDDDAVIHALVDEMNRAAGDFGAVAERLLLRVEPREGRKQRGVNVQDAVREALDKGRRKDAHVAGEDDEVDPVLLKSSDHLGVMFRPLSSDGADGVRGEAELGRGDETWSVQDIGENDGDLGAGDLASLDRLSDCDEVGAAAGEKNT